MSTKAVSFRVTNEEYKELERKASLTSQSVGQYAKQTALEEPAKPLKEEKQEQQAEATASASEPSGDGSALLILQEQLKAKDEQIKSLQELLKDNQKIIDQQQQLHLGLQKLLPEPQQENCPTKREKQDKENKGLFRRLFNR